MPLSKQELLIPRYKVIALWPYEIVSKVGDIYQQPDCHRGGQWTALWKWWDEMGKYPHLFQPLPWWSDRKPEDMPMFVREVDSLYKICEVIKVKEWALENEESDCPCFQDEKDNHFTWVRGFEPATEEEYTAYINQKQQ